MEFAELAAMLLLCDLSNACQKAADRRTVGTDVEHIAVFRQMHFSKGDRLFGKGIEIDAGS